MAVNHREAAFEGRVSAAKMARDRVHPEHKANGDEQRYATAHYPMSFTKGLDHNQTTGLVNDHGHFEAFRQCIDEGWIEPVTTRAPVPTPPAGKGRRKWEAPTAGVVYELEGPDPQAVTMPPAPELRSEKLTFEVGKSANWPCCVTCPSPNSKPARWGSWSQWRGSTPCPSRWTAFRARGDVPAPPRHHSMRRPPSAALRPAATSDLISRSS